MSMGITSSLPTLSTSLVEPHRGELRDIAEVKEGSSSDNSRSSTSSWGSRGHWLHHVRDRRQSPG